MFGASTRHEPHAPAGTLAEILAVQGPLPDHQVAGVGVGIAQYLAVLHQSGRVHGDVQPAAVLLPGHDVLWLAPRLSPRAATAAADLTKLAITLVECATGLVIDGAESWTPESLVEIGCSTAMADVIGSIRPQAGAASAVDALTRPDQVLPRRSNDFA